jgi:NAD(P)-dependent dehydrogenase (short-subunit alcohol dehydrogenase family)
VSLDGKVVVVTGAGRGVGRGMAAAFAAAGAGVVVASHHLHDGVDAVAAMPAGAAVAVECDVTSPADVDRAVDTALERFGRLDAFVHNAVSSRSNETVALAGVDAPLWEEHAAVSIRATFSCARAAYGALRSAGGTFLVMLSPAGIEGSGDRPLYAMVKGAQRGFVKSLAREWGPDGIRVNGIAPLATSPAMEAAFARDPSMEQRLTRVIPLGRMGDPQDDIGPAAVFLCGDGARYITGQTLVVSGGRFTAL